MRTSEGISFDFQQTEFRSLFRLTISLTRTQKVGYFVTLQQPLLDITPILTSFQGLGINPYAFPESILDVEEFLLDVDPMELSEFLQHRSKIVLMLFTSIVEQQKCVVEDRMKISPEVSFEIEMVKQIDGVTIVSSRNPELYVFSIEFPLPLSKRHTDSNCQYLVDMMGIDQIVFTRDINFSIMSGNSTSPTMNAADRIFIPNRMLTSTHIDFKECLLPLPTSSSAPMEYRTIHDIIFTIEDKLLMKYSHRKKFVEVLCQVSATIEFDAVDFSFAVVAVRIKSQVACSLCTIEMRLTQVGLSVHRNAGSSQLFLSPAYNLCCA